jgi:hypothetical protein
VGGRDSHSLHRNKVHIRARLRSLSQKFSSFELRSHLHLSPLPHCHFSFSSRFLDKLSLVPFHPRQGFHTTLSGSLSLSLLLSLTLCEPGSPVSRDPTI